MTHLELENLASEYLEGLLEAVARVEVEAHLKECAACRELIADVRHALEMCQAAEELEPAPWLVSKIMLATVGERKPSFGGAVGGFLRPAGRMRLAYSFAMAVFSFSIIVNAAGINLRHLTHRGLESSDMVLRGQQHRAHDAVACRKVLLRPARGLRDRIPLAPVPARLGPGQR